MTVYPVDSEIAVVHIHYLTLTERSTRLFSCSQYLTFCIRQNKSYRAGQKRKFLPPICYHPYVCQENMPHSWHLRSRGKEHCRTVGKIVKMAEIHCKFKLWPQWLLPTFLQPLDTKLECLQTHTEPFFSVNKVGIVAYSLTKKLEEKIH